jgi:glycosyltransferase involved in cell wall biosynthesis
VFTSNLGRVMGDREIVALHSPEDSNPYAIEVHHRIRRDEPSDYTRTAHSLSSCADIVSIQHEYGIWGGEDGESVLDFLGALEVPAVATLHTVRREPTERQQAILAELIRGVRSTIVMSRSAADLVTRLYGADPKRVEVIPHGVPDLPLVSSEATKAGLGLSGHEVILSFGLLGPGKGYELAIDALPAILKQHPKACLVIVGATHPGLVAREGESYRASLAARAAKLKLADHLRFVERFVGRVELTRWLEAADVYVSPTPDLDHSVSGTLTYAMGAGRAIVATPYAYATEMLADGRGLLLDDLSPEGLATAVNGLLDDEPRRLEMGRRAHEHSRRMVWSEVGAEYRRVFSRVVAEPRRPVRPVSRSSIAI